MRQSPDEFLPPELALRVEALNNAPQRAGADYVLVWLQQSLRGDDHPVIDAASVLANRLGLPVLVYHGLRCDYPYASARLSRFILGASAAMGRSLRSRGIACRQFVQQGPDHGRGLVYRLASKAAAVFVDQHFTFVPATQPGSFAGRAGVAVYAVDAARVVPVRALPARVGTTAAFRRAHSTLRHDWLAMRCPIQPEQRTVPANLPGELVELADHDEPALDRLVAGLPIDQTLGSVAEHPATAEAASARLAGVDAQFVRQYSAKRTNPALAEGTSRLSPYLRFGMIAPWQVMARVEALDVTASQRYKFYDELLTWREWSHWRAWRNPEIHRYAHLAAWARETLDAHRADPREPVLSLAEIMHARTPDRVWNAAQAQWLLTGWMHNNLRMYWSKGLLRWAPDPETAWAWGCYINDRVSIDGRDPATYVSMRWGFGDARPAWKETPVYGRLMRASTAAMMKRDGVADFVDHWTARLLPEIDLASFDREYYV